MIKKAFLLTILLINALWLPSSLASTSILLLGDSLSASYGMKQDQGWVHLLNQQLAQQKSGYHIVNASISGETTAGGLARLPGILSKQKPDYLLVELGGNDGLRGFPPKLIKNNLLQIIKQAQAKNIKVLLMNIRIPPNYGPRYNKMFAEVFEQVAQETNTPLLPFFVETVAIKPELMQADGIHPTQQAQPLIVDIMEKQLAKLIANSKS